MLGTKMLVIDSDTAICELIKTHFQNEGYDVAVANDGQEGVSLFKSYAPDIILLDMILPKKDGTDVCREIRANSNKPMIMITAKGDVFDKVLSFIKRAGSVILVSSIILWFLLSFSFKFEYGVDVENSILASIGKLFSWVFYPILGEFSWAATVSAIQGLVAKEQVVGSMAVIANVSEEGNMIFNSGVFSFFNAASAYAFVVFNLFSAPCFGAIGAMKKELGSTKKMMYAILLQTGLAWIIAVLVNLIGNLFI